MSNLSKVKDIRTRARKEIEAGAVTRDYQLDPVKVVKLLNEALASEIVCVLRYRFHYFMASGIHSAAVAPEFLVHSNEEQIHADQLAIRIRQLGGKPEMNPATIADRSHSEYTEGATLSEMIREDLIAERIAVESYRELITYFGEKDPTTRRLIEEILAMEEAHADELADLLVAVDPDTSSSRKYAFKEELPTQTNHKGNDKQKHSENGKELAGVQSQQK